MPTPLEEIKEKIDIVDFIKSYLSLQPAGKNFKALCPFHQEKTPSFIVSPDRKIWHCFGCNAGGDVIKFLMLYENLEFYEALRVLAEKAGVEFRRLNLQDQKEFNLLYDLNEKAKNFFKEQLDKSAAAKEYLKKRGLRPATIEEFEVGFTPGGETLVLYLLNLGYNINDIVKAGLAIKTDKGRYIDRFRGRIMFPIYNSFGKTIGFSGRLLPSLETPEAGKYVNSPETPLFNKSRILYGFHKAKQEINRSQTAFLVEGQMDFLMTWQSEIKNVVATSGTALGPDQLKILKRLADNLIISFDQDEAGVKALERSLELFNNFSAQGGPASGGDFNVKVLDLNGYKDPAEAAEKDSNFLKNALKRTQPAFVCLFNFYLSDNQDWSVKKRNIRHLLRYIKTLKSAIEQSHWLKELSLKSGIEEKILAQELAVIKINPPAGGSTAVEEAAPTAVGETTKPSRWELVCQKLVALTKIKSEFLNLLNENYEYFPVNWQEPALLDLRSSYEFSDFDETALKKEAEELIKQLKIEFKQNQRRQLQKEIKSTQTDEALKKFHVISREINNLQNNQ
jgi:DNA primase